VAIVKALRFVWVHNSSMPFKRQFLMKQSAGLLLYRIREGSVEVFLVHPGGPYWTKKDSAGWSIPKGEFEEDEDPLQAALREFTEETGLDIPQGEPLPLKPVKQSGYKQVHAWYLRGDLDAAAINSNTFELEWPPKSGRKKIFPEVDKAGWFGLDEAKEKLHKGQVPIIDQLVDALGLAQT
jgi:predicted NUDIX family NTP pyrophosphohydrolase